MRLSFLTCEGYLEEFGILSNFCFVIYVKITVLIFFLNFDESYNIEDKNKNEKFFEE